MYQGSVWNGGKMAETLEEQDAMIAFNKASFRKSSLEPLKGLGPWFLATEFSLFPDQNLNVPEINNEI